MNVAARDGLEDQAEVPSRGSSLVFEAKREGLRWKRRLSDFRGGPRRYSKMGAPADFPHSTGLCRTALRCETTEAERRLEDGKIANLQVAAGRLDGVVIPAGGVFSFWRQVGPPTARRGFTQGRMLQQGCMVASVGGGLCQPSNSLYDVALQAGCDIVERHRHSRLVPGSQGEQGRDATVAWNYVDLRFRPPSAMRLEVRVDAEFLLVKLTRTSAPAAPAITPVEAEPTPPTARTCSSCGQLRCHRHEGDGRPLFTRD